MDVRDVGVALWRQRLLVLVILVVAGAAVGAGVLLAPKTYAATATISTADQRDASDAPSDPDALRATLAELASSRAVATEVRTRLDVDRDTDELRRSVDGHWVRGTILVDVTAEDRDPEVAAEVANTVADVLAEGRVTAGVPAEVFVITTIDRAEPPESFTDPDLGLVVSLGLLLALGVATVAAVVRDRRTHTVDDAASVEEAATAPLLAHLAAPHDLTELPALQPGTAEADLFRHLRFTVELQLDSAGSGRVVVAGVASGDVNVWIGANLALALARTGHRVLLVDGRMGERFGKPVEDAPDTPGLYDVLLGADLDAAVSPGPVDLLQVLPAGTWGDEPVAELIEEGFASVMEAAEADFDHVVVLGPPLEVCEDSRVMAVDGSLVLAVVEGAVSAATLRSHADRARAVGARVLGVVLVSRASDRRAGQGRRRLGRRSGR